MLLLVFLVGCGSQQDTCGWVQNMGPRYVEGRSATCSGVMTVVTENLVKCDCVIPESVVDESVPETPAVVSGQSDVLLMNLIVSCISSAVFGAFLGYQFAKSLRTERNKMH